MRALHLYEELGLLAPASRTSGGFRLFDEAAETRIRWIELLQESGFTLHKIQELLRAWLRTPHGPEAMATLRRTFEQRLAETRQSIERSQRLARELQESLHYLNACQQCRPTRSTQVDCPQCPEDHGMKEEPALVAGFHLSPSPDGPLTLRVTEERP